ncbi:hypothetical protein [Lentzea flava]|uniref:Uncharacterized protein n=1 Tax=Lentzea flava TaxID=103732 RepID=A0ABQ2V4B8_9PSEU|nr:hypothetical protein [Lentzea flava]GGU68475.1 hypothetical protein GCM10010178_70410 [Lentzea flava]
MLFTLSMVVLTPIAALGMLLDDRVLLDSPIWFKPFKFAVSFTLYSASLAWFTSLLEGRLHKIAWWFGTVFALAGVAEMAIIVGQVVRGKRSHFNFETPLDTALFGAMGVLAMVLFGTSFVIAVVLFRKKFDDAAKKWAIRLSLLISLVGMSVGFLMTQPHAGQSPAKGVVGSHSIGGPDGGAYMPLTGWSTVHGDLRIGHFVGMHAVQILPLLIFFAGRWANARLAWVLSGGYLGITLLVTWQALRGQALIKPDALTLIVAAAIAVATGLGVMWARQTKNDIKKEYALA